MIIKQRIITALVALPLLILLIAFSGTVLFNLVVVGIVVLGLFEYCRMCLPVERKLENYAALVCGAALTVGLQHDPSLLAPILTAITFFFAILFLLRFRELANVSQHLALVLLGLLYLPLLLGHLSLLRSLPLGREWIFLVLFIVMSGDSGAYFIGVRYGKRRLYPAISPKKSIEGAIGGLVGSFFGALFFKLMFFSALSLKDCLLLGLGLGALGQLGDLFESMLKRSFGVKDSGTLIPGHGGILDRLDSLIFAFAPAYYYALWCFHPTGILG